MLLWGFFYVAYSVWWEQIRGRREALIVWCLKGRITASKKHVKAFHQLHFYLYLLCVWKMCSFSKKKFIASFWVTFEQISTHMIELYDFLLFQKQVSSAKKKDLSDQSCRTSRLSLNREGEDLAILPRRSASIPSPPPGIGLVPIPTLRVNDWINAPTAALQVTAPEVLTGSMWSQWSRRVAPTGGRPVR